MAYIYFGGLILIKCYMHFMYVEQLDSEWGYIYILYSVRDVPQYVLQRPDDT